MRNIEFLEKEYYLLSGTCAGNGQLFKEEVDYIRFIFLLLYFQSPIAIQNVSFYAHSYLSKGRFPLGETKLRKIIKTRQVEPIAFVLMPGYYHLLLRNVEKHSVSAYMQRLLMAYGKYFNAKYKKSGHVFGGPYRCLHLKNNRELLAATRHVHLDPEQSYEDYKFSSCPDYLVSNRWGELLKPELVLDQFKNSRAYEHFLHSAATEDDLMLDF